VPAFHHDVTAESADGVGVKVVDDAGKADRDRDEDAREAQRLLGADHSRFPVEEAEVERQHDQHECDERAPEKKLHSPPCNSPRRRPSSSASYESERRFDRQSAGSVQFAAPIGAALAAPPVPC
jgi:hypothetical protein